MRTVSLSEINHYSGNTVNPLRFPDEQFELYSVPSYDNQYPEIIKGADIGSSKVTVEAGDVLICKINPRINRVWVVSHNTPHQLLASSEWIIVRSPENNADYLRHYFKSARFQTMMVSQVTGIGGSLTRAQPKQVATYPVPLPDRETQNRIADIFNHIEQLVDMRKEQFATLDELVKSRFVEMFGDPVQNPKKWIQKPFAAICENLDSRRVPITSTDRKAGQYPYYGASGIVDYVDEYIFDENLLLVSEDGANLLMRSTPIAFSISGKTWVNNHAHVLRFGSLALQRYIEVYFSMIDISGSITGTAQPKLNQAKLNEMLFSIPPESLIEDFYAFLTQADKSKLAVKKSLEELEMLKKSLMQKYFG